MRLFRQQILLPVSSQMEYLYRCPARPTLTAMVHQTSLIDVRMILILLTRDSAGMVIPRSIQMVTGHSIVSISASEMTIPEIQTATEFVRPMTPV